MVKCPKDIARTHRPVLSLGVCVCVQSTGDTKMIFSLLCIFVILGPAFGSCIFWWHIGAIWVVLHPLSAALWMSVGWPFTGFDQTRLIFGRALYLCIFNAALQVIFGGHCCFSMTPPPLLHLLWPPSRMAGGMWGWYHDHIAPPSTTGAKEEVKEEAKEQKKRKRLRPARNPHSQGSGLLIPSPFSVTHARTPRNTFLSRAMVKRQLPWRKQIPRSLLGKGLSLCGDIHQLDGTLMPEEGLGWVERGAAATLEQSGVLVVHCTMTQAGSKARWFEPSQWDMP